MIDIYSTVPELLGGVLAAAVLFGAAGLRWLRSVAPDNDSCSQCPTCGKCWVDCRC